MNAYQVIDEKNWARAMHGMVFRESVEPAFVDGIHIGQFADALQKYVDEYGKMNP